MRLFTEVEEESDKVCRFKTDDGIRNEKKGAANTDRLEKPPCDCTLWINYDY